MPEKGGMYFNTDIPVSGPMAFSMVKVSMTLIRETSLSSSYSNLIQGSICILDARTIKNNLPSATN